MRHEAGARAEDRQVGSALSHLGKLVGLDALAQLVVGDLQVIRFGCLARILERRDLEVAPRAQRGGAVV